MPDAQISKFILHHQSGGHTVDELQIRLCHRSSPSRKKANKSIEEFNKIDFSQLRIQSKVRDALFKFCAFIISKTAPLLGKLGFRNIRILSKVQTFRGVDTEIIDTIQQSREETRIFGGETVEAYNQCLRDCKPARRYKTQLHFVEKLDSLRIGISVAEELKDPSKVVVTNFANSVHVGGAFQLGGNGSQEEDLFKNSYLFNVLNPKLNCTLKEKLEQVHSNERHIPYLGVVLTPTVPLFEEQKTANCSTMSFISVAAPDRRKTYQEMDFIRKFSNSPEGLIDKIFKAKIRMIFAAAVANNHTHLVLGKLGCGAFRNKPATVARCINEVLHEKKFAHAFDHIYFPVETLNEDQFPDENKFISEMLKS